MTLSEKAHLRRLKALEQISSADLESLLLLDFQSLDSNEAEMDKVLRAAEILAEREHRQDDGRADRAWEAFLEKYLPFAEDKSLYESAEARCASAVAVQPRPAAFLSLPQWTRRLVRPSCRPVWHQIVRAAACLALCLLLSGSLLLIFNPEARSVFSGWIQKICGAPFIYHCASSGSLAIYTEAPPKAGGVITKP